MIPESDYSATTSTPESATEQERRARIQNLEAELAAVHAENGTTAERPRAAASYVDRQGLLLVAGSHLVHVTKRAWGAWEQWLRDGRPDAMPTPETRDFAAAVLARLLRIGTVALLLVLFPTVILIAQLFIMKSQNRRLDAQNQLIERQTFLAEASSRSTLVFELSAVLELIQEEVAQLASQGAAPPYRLSHRLENRIITMSRSLRPYRYHEAGRLTERELSPERGQLLIALIDSTLRAERIIQQADFSSADLTGAALRSADLTGADLTGADLTEAVLTGAVLRRTDLTGADLTGADLTGSGLTGAILTGATLTGSGLTGAGLTGADLTEADLTGSGLLGADLTGAVLRSANLTGSGLFGADLTGTVLTEADLTGADLTEAILTGTDLTGADLTEAVLTEADLCSTRWLTGVVMERTLADSLRTACPEKFEGPSN